MKMFGECYEDVEMVSIFGVCLGDVQRLFQGCSEDV